MGKISQPHMEKLNRRLENAIKEKEEQNVKLDLAVQLGDLSENAEFDAAKEAVTKLNMEIPELLAKVKEAQIIPIDSSNKLAHGSLFEIAEYKEGGSGSLTDESSWEGNRLVILLPEGNYKLDYILKSKSPVGTALLNKPVKLEEPKLFEVRGYKYRIIKYSDTSTKVQDFENLIGEEESNMIRARLLKGIE